MPLCRSTLAFLGCLALLACGGGIGGGGDGGDGPSMVPTPCPDGPFLTTAPIDLASITSIVPLGNLNPPGHTFPSDHMYFYLDGPGGGAAPYETTLYAPGDLYVRSATASEHLVAGYTDYGIVLGPCQAITIRLAHVTSLDPSVFGDVVSMDGWTLLEEYSTGGETYRTWRRTYDLPVTAGTVLGTTGGRVGQWALDVGAYDEWVSASPVANAARWGNGSYLHAVCPLLYYPSGALRTALEDLLSRSAFPGDPWPCGRVMQDVPATAQGVWFVEGTTETYPEDPHLALVWSNHDPLECVISVGQSISGYGPGTRTFTPLSTGRRNRAFTAITPDGLTYGYELPSPPGLLVMQMPDAVTLEVEYLPTATSDPSTWVFTSDRLVFER